MEKPTKLGIIAGRGIYPRLLAESARKQGVSYLFAVAFKQETDSAIEQVVDKVAWLRLGQLEAMLNAMAASGVKQAVMAGQITPTHLFSILPDRRMLQLLGQLRIRNAETIFGTIAEELKAHGIELLPAYMFMESAMPHAGQLSRHVPTDEQQNDIDLGFKVAKATSGLEIGQTVVIKQGTILAVEAFEGTDEAMLRAARLGGQGVVVVKVAKKGHDMRFDIPAIGMQTMKVLKKIKASVLAIEANRTILLEREKLIHRADNIGLCLCAVDVKEDENSDSH